MHFQKNCNFTLFFILENQQMLINLFSLLIFGYLYSLNQITYFTTYQYIYISIYILIKGQMQRKIWTPQEDNVLRELIIDRKIKKWSAIARAMEIQYKIIGRSGKQCRQRWHNQLDPKIKNDEWTKEEQQKLFNLHDQLGNKWAMIAQRIPGRYKFTDNCLKNHFYSTLRKGIRRLNKFISDTKQKGQMKQIKNIILKKLLSGAEQKFGNRLVQNKKLVQYCVEIKHKLILIANGSAEKQTNQSNEQFMRTLINDIIIFTKESKKKLNKKKKNNETEQIPTKTIQLNKSKKSSSKKSKIQIFGNIKMDKVKSYFQEAEFDPPTFQTKNSISQNNLHRFTSGINFQNIINTNKMELQNYQVGMFNNTGNICNNVIKLALQLSKKYSNRVLPSNLTNSELFKQK